MSCNKHDKETEREEFEQNLRELVIYTLDEESRKDEDVVETYFQAFMLAFEEYKNMYK